MPNKIEAVYTLEDDDIVKEYIDAFKCHIDNGQLTVKEFDTIAWIIREYFKGMGAISSLIFNNPNNQTFLSS